MKHIIDTDKTPRIPYYNWKIESHKGMGIIDWDKILPQLYLSENQKKGYVKGYDLLKEFGDKNPLNATVLNYLLEHEDIIPESWKGKEVFFWGTIYLHSGGSMYVRYLYWDCKSWQWNYRWLDGDFFSRDPAAVAGKSFYSESLDNNDLKHLELNITISVNGKKYKLIEE